jgi:phosphatidylglycerophosphate synthase
MCDLPAGFEVLVKPGDKVSGGSTVSPWTVRRPAWAKGERMFIRMGDHKKTVPALVLVPNLVTTLALCCGLASLHFALLKDWDKALAAIVLSGIFDVLDGAAARLLRVSRRFGAVLDSLSDFLAFGVAPALILQQWLLVPAAANGTEKPARWLVTLTLVAVMTFAVCKRAAAGTLHERAGQAGPGTAPAGSPR